jgi:hypothetical protein
MKLFTPIRRPSRLVPSSGLVPRSQKNKNEEGYILLLLLLGCALMAIAFTAIIVPFKFQIERAQETEMIHRGVQYTRAIRGYYKKFGRYPTKLEDLDNTQNLRYLRKHYKDPIASQEFKLLHYGDPGLSIGGSIGSTPINGATPAGAAMNSPNGSAFGSSSGFGNGGTLNNSSFGGSSFGNSNSSFGNNNSSFGNSGGSSGVNSQGVFAESSGNANGGNAGSQGTTGQQGADQTSGQDSSQGSNGTTGPGQGSGTGGSGNQTVFGGGPIVGVASVSKKKTIRIYNKKTKYNEWQFVYDPTADRGGLITTPYQPGLQNFGTNNLNGQNGTNGQPGSTNSSPFSNGNNSSFGQSSSSFGQSSFGQNSGFGNNSNQNNNPPAQPSSNSPQ